jgi:iron complex transport system substrate-binding protein
VRIVSLLPSATEIVSTLGLEAQLVGVTHECDFPESVRRLPKVTRTLIPMDAASAEIDRLVVDRMSGGKALYTLDMAALESLRPDLIVTQSLCGVCAVAERDVEAAVCALPCRPRVVSLEPASLRDVLASIRTVAAAADVADRADEVISALQRRIDAVVARSATVEYRPRMILLEWIDPPYTCGHWSPELVRLAGGVEGLGREGEPSRRTSWDEILAWQPEVLVIACCGFEVERTLRDLPILTARPGWSDLPCVRDDRVFIVDGSAYFSRSGPRLVDSLEILADVLHPESSAGDDSEEGSFWRRRRRVAQLAHSHGQPMAANGLRDDV